MFPRELPQFPALKDGEGGKATDFKGKVKALRRVLFPPPPQADLEDIEGIVYPAPIDFYAILELREVWEAIRHLAADKALGTSGLLNRFLRVLCEGLIKAVVRLFQACLDRGYHPKRFKEANTIILKKPKKPDYLEPKVYRPIALLDILGKALETVVSRRLSSVVERYRLLPEQ